MPRRHLPRPRQALAVSNQGIHSNQEHRTPRYDGYYEPREIDGYGPAPFPVGISMPHQPQTPLQHGIGLPGMQLGSGNVPTGYNPPQMGNTPMWPQSYHPALNHMQHFNEAPWMDPYYGINPYLAMTHANIQNPPHHYRQPPPLREPVPDFS
jgi:hypothetical protein